MRLTVVACVAAGVCAFLVPTPALAKTPRRVEIRWDFRQASSDALEVWINCPQDRPDVYSCGTDSGSEQRKLKGPNARLFELLSTDQVVLVVISRINDDKNDISFAVTGTDLSVKDLEKLKTMFGAASTQAKANATGTAGEDGPETKKADIKAVTDDLIPGGKLTVTYSLKKTENGQERVTNTSGAITFHIAQESPLITVSYGIGFGTAANPTVAVSKTSTIVSFQKDGKPQQAYQQTITLTDADTSLKPILAMLTFANVRLVGRVYASVGVQLDKKLFESPMVGPSYRHPLGQRTGFNVFAGVQFSRETEIDSASGFEPGKPIDPTLGLTAADVPTKAAYHRRLAIAFSMDF